MPPNMKADERVPAIMLLHDAGDDPLAAVYRHGWIATAIQAHFAIIVPKGGLQSRRRSIAGFFNARVWNAGSANAAAWAGDESVEAVAIDAQKRRRLDPDRIYLVGFGEGGAMALLVLENKIDLFAAFASVSGPLYASPAGLIARPLLLLFGLADPTNPASGGAIYTPWAGAEERAPLAQHIGGWRDQLGCSKRPDVNPVTDMITRQI
jgi:poly(3-hydroxybutyrate) depolymerase